MDMKATEETYHTLVGVYGEPPHQRGNCFGVKGEDGKEYRIVNFVYENLEALEAAGLTWPIDIRVLGGSAAVFHDRRIPSNWYQTHFCEVCCPSQLLPLPQLLRREREVMQGVCKEHPNGVVEYRIGKEPDCLVKPNVRVEGPDAPADGPARTTS